MKANMRNSEAGFTLVEALVAIVILVFGLIAVTNLMVVAGTSNTVANNSTAAATEASQVLERLKAIPFRTLQVGGNLTADAGNSIGCDAALADCTVPGNFNQQRNLPGVGNVKTRWTITAMASVDIAGETANSAYFIEVSSQGLSPLAGQRSRADFTTFRVCPSGPPDCP